MYIIFLKKSVATVAYRIGIILWFSLFNDILFEYGTTTKPYYLDTYIVEKGALGPEYEWATLILVFSRDGLGHNLTQATFFKSPSYQKKMFLMNIVNFCPNTGIFALKMRKKVIPSQILLTRDPTWARYQNSKPDMRQEKWTQPIPSYFRRIEWS